MLLNERKGELGVTADRTDLRGHAGGDTGLPLVGEREVERTLGQPGIADQRNGTLESPTLLLF